MTKNEFPSSRRYRQVKTRSQGEEEALGPEKIILRL